MYERKRLAEIARLSREPFRAPLDLWLEHAPKPEDLATVARKSPDRWAQGLAVLARLSGYTEKLEVDASPTFANLMARMHALPDAELHTLARELAAGDPSAHHRVLALAEPAEQPSEPGASGDSGDDDAAADALTPSRSPLPPSAPPTRPPGA